MRFISVTVLVAAMFVSVPVLAHHATQAEFDKNASKTIAGVLTRVQWTNPHVRWYLEVKDTRGEVSTWMIQGSGPGVYRANGITAAGVFPIGGTYTALIAPARDGSNGGYIMAWTLPDGTKMDFWHDYGEK